MSKIVDLNKPLSDDDRKYLEERGRRHDIIVNDRQFGPGGEGAHPVEESGSDVEVIDIDSDIAEHVLSLNEAELKSELIKHGLQPLGHKDDLQEALAIYLQLLKESRFAEAEAEKQKLAKAAERA